MRAQFNYSNNWTQSLHQLNLLSGFEMREANSISNASTYYGYNVNTGVAVPVDGENMFKKYPSNSWEKINLTQGTSGLLQRFRSYYFNGSYTYDSRYTFSASARIDQTNLFGVKTNQRSIPLWSGGMKWNIGEERFYENSWLPKLQLRMSYGYNGNFDPAATSYITASYFTTKYGFTEARLGSLPNPELKGERTGVWNTGIDFSTYKDRISGRIEYYRKKGTNLIGDGPIDPTTGRATFRGNLANMKGYGWDVELKTKNINKSAFSWTSDVWWSYNDDKVTHYEVLANKFYYFNDASLSGYSFQISPTVGDPMFSVYSYPWAGLDPTNGDPLGYLNGKPSADYAAISSNATIDSLTFHGRALPSNMGSFRNTFQFKQWSISANLLFKFGYYFRRSSTRLDYNPALSTLHPDFANRWKKPGDEEITQVPSVLYSPNASRTSFYQNSSVLVEKGDHIRVQDVQLNYSFSDHSLQRMPFSSLRVYAYTSNLGILWRANKLNIDPDFNTNSTLGGISYPTPLAFAIGIQANFL